MEDLAPELEWPEAGPSTTAIERSALSDRTLGPKAIAAMTGASATSLLSKLLPSRPLTGSDTL